MSLDALPLFGRAMVDPDLDTELPHLKGGVLSSSFVLVAHEWCQAMRMRKLPDPAAPTYDAGPALDEFPCVPDLYVPSAVFEDFHLGGLGIEEMRR